MPHQRRVAQCWMGITTGPGGAELILAGDETPLTEIEMGYKPGGREAKSWGTVKLIWNSPTATRPAKLAGIVTVPMVTVTPLHKVVVTGVPAGDGARPVAKSCTVSPGTALRNAGPIDGSAAILPSRKTAAS